MTDELDDVRLPVVGDCILPTYVGSVTPEGDPGEYRALYGVPLLVKSVQLPFVVAQPAGCPTICIIDVRLGFQWIHTTAEYVNGFIPTQQPRNGQ